MTTHLPIEIHLNGVDPNHTQVNTVLAHVARSINMWSWAQEPSRVTLCVDPSASFILVAAAICQLASTIGGIARWSGKRRGWLIEGKP